MAITDFTDTPLADLTSLKGRRACVTGGARGMGLAIAKRLAEAGASVVIGDLDESAAKAALDSIRATAAGDVFAFGLDVADEASVTGFADAAQDKLGGLDIWVNNAGVYPIAPFLDIDMDRWNWVLDVNLKGVFICSQQAARRMIASHSSCGVIVNISSLAGFRAHMGMADYVAAKHGVVGLTKSMALELGPKNIRVLGIAPAMVLTHGNQGIGGTQAFRNSLPLGRPGVPDDIARAVLFCASDLSALMTGSTLYVDYGSAAGIFP